MNHIEDQKILAAQLIQDLIIKEIFKPKIKLSTCSWCNSVIPMFSVDSHGICKECADSMIKEHNN